MKNKGFVLIEVVMSFFLISLLGTLIVLIYIQTISKYDDIREERKAYILVNNVHQEFLSNPKFYLRHVATPDDADGDSIIDYEGNIGGVLYYDEYLRACGRGERFIYQVYFNVTHADGFAKLYIAGVERRGEELITDIDLGKMRLEP